MHPQRNLIESAMQVVINEAKDGDLHNKLKASISKEYGIPADHKAWNTIRPQASIEHYTAAVYAAFPDEIDGRHEQLNKEQIDRKAPSSRLPMQREHERIKKENLSRGEEGDQAVFRDFVSDAHHDLTKGK